MLKDEIENRKKIRRLLNRVYCKQCYLQCNEEYDVKRKKIVSQALTRILELVEKERRDEIQKETSSN